MRDRHRVLVVDDEALIRETLEAVLLDEGYEVRSAANGREALQVLERWRPDLILLDLMMPVMDGWTLREEQRRRDGIRDLPVIVLSGARDVRAAAEQLGASLAVAKPFDLDDVLSGIAQILGRRSQ